MKEAGYAYIYISNDNPTQVDVYFDEVSITHTPTNIIQYNEYYPFGLQAATSWTRENNRNDYLYNEGSELNAVSGWYETFFRSYDPTLGRFMQVDPLATVTHNMSAYQYAGNNPVVFNDPSGLLYRPRDNQAPHWDLSSLPIWTGSRDEWSDQSGGGGGAQFAWNPLGGEEISREEWLERGGDPNVHADHYYPGAWEIQFGGETESTHQDELVVNFYESWSTPSEAGLMINLIFKNTGNKYNDVRWVQTVWTNYSPGVKAPFNDPAPPDDDLPFFWTRDENKFHINYDGTNAEFRDVPRRDFEQDSYWLAELSVVSRLADGTYAPIETITYGFRIVNGKISQFGLARNVTPSAFHLSTFLNKKFK